MKFNHRSPNRICYPILICVVLFVGLFHANASEEKKRDDFIFLPQWLPQAQFLGYYIAQHKGIYKKYGLDLTIVKGGPESPPEVFLADKRVDLATMWLSSAISARDKGINIVNISQIVQKSALMLVAWKSSGIKRPEDLHQRKVGLWPGMFEVQPRAFFKKYNVSPVNIRQSYSISLFRTGCIDASTMMWYNEYNRLLMSGVNREELTTFFFSEHGLNFPEDGIYVLEETLKQSPRACENFIKASIEGWEYAFSNQEEAINLILKLQEKSGVPANRVHQKWMLQRMKDLMILDNETLIRGSLSPDDYARVATLLKEYGFINNIPRFDQFYYKFSNHETK